MTAFGPTNRICYGRASAFIQEILSAAEVGNVVDAVNEARDILWQGKWDWPDYRMFTIGEPLYQNCQRLRTYHESARRLNHEIFERFSDLYERLALFFEGRYGSSVLFAEELAIPGFHIYEYNSAGEYDAGSWHFDRGYMSLPVISNAQERVRGIVNFTLPLEVPSGGTTLETCDRQPGDAECDEYACTAVPYEPGKMVFSEKHYWHRMGPSICLAQRERRITLQGHGINVQGRWVLFW